MAFTATSLDATDEKDWWDADKPMLSANTGFTGDTQWVAGDSAADWTDPSDDDPDYPSSRLFDDKPAFVSKPDSASTAFTLLFDWSSSPIEFDWIGVMNHNLYTLTTTVFRVEVSDTSNFAATTFVFQKNISTAYSSDRRFADTSLGSTAVLTRYSDVPYARFRITCSSGTPYIGQVVFGRRRQQKYKPMLAWSPDDGSSNIGLTTTRAGVRYKNAFYRERRDLGAVLLHDETALQDDLLDWWADIEAGERNYFWHDDGSDESNFVMFDLPEPAFDYPYIDNTNRRFELRGEEQGPESMYYNQGPR